MTHDLNIHPQSLLDRSFNVRQERRKLLKTFWLGVAVLLLVEIFTVNHSSFASIVGASLIAFTALLPIYLWCSGKALGMPIFPVFALTYLWTHALPLLSENPKILAYPPEQHLIAGLTVAGFLLLGTFIWFQFVKSPAAIPKSYRVFRGHSSDGLFLVVLLVGIFFNMYSLGGWFDLGAIFSLIRSAILGINVLAVFVLSYRSGTKELGRTKSSIFFIFLILYVTTSAVSLILVSALSVVFLSATAFTVGRRKLPLIPVIIVLTCLTFLHYGKAEMRAKYWSNEQAHFVQPWEYPAWYGEWIDNSFNYFSDREFRKASQEKASLLERSSVIHLLLKTQSLAPKEVPYLSGQTYAIIPQLLVPRVLNENKLRSHEGTYLLNISYGLQDRHATLKTTIGWGLLSEAYANFGLYGCTGLAIILGIVYGQVTRWSLNTSFLSFRSLFSALMLSFAFQAEWTAGVYVAAFFQSFVILLIITIVFMKVQKSKSLVIPYMFDNAVFRSQESE